MRKTILSLLLVCLLTALLLPAAAFAEEGTQQSFPYVLDNAGLLSDSQRQTLEQRAAELSEEHGLSLIHI